MSLLEPPPQILRIAKESDLHLRTAIRRGSHSLCLISVTDLAPVRECVETWRKGKLLLAGAVRIDQKELELPRHTPVEHDLPSIG